MRGRQARPQAGKQAGRQAGRQAGTPTGTPAHRGGCLPSLASLNLACMQEPVAKGGFRAMAEELARDINRHATVVLGGAHSLEEQQQRHQQRGAGPSSSSSSSRPGLSVGHSREGPSHTAGAEPARSAVATAGIGGDAGSKVRGACAGGGQGGGCCVCEHVCMPLQPQGHSATTSRCRLLHLLQLGGTCVWLELRLAYFPVRTLCVAYRALRPCCAHANTSQTGARSAEPKIMTSLRLHALHCGGWLGCKEPRGVECGSMRRHPVLHRAAAGRRALTLVPGCAVQLQGGVHRHPRRTVPCRAAAGRPCFPAWVMLSSCRAARAATCAVPWCAVPWCAVQLQGDEALDELAAARLHGYGAGLEDLRAPKHVQVGVGVGWGVGWGAWPPRHKGHMATKQKGLYSCTVVAAVWPLDGVRCMATGWCALYGHRLVCAVWPQDGVRCMATGWCALYGHRMVCAVWPLGWCALYGHCAHACRQGLHEPRSVPALARSATNLMPGAQGAPGHGRSDASVLAHIRVYTHIHEHARTRSCACARKVQRALSTHSCAPAVHGSLARCTPSLCVYVRACVCVYVCVCVCVCVCAC